MLKDYNATTKKTRWNSIPNQTILHMKVKLRCFHLHKTELIADLNYKNVKQFPPRMPKHSDPPPQVEVLTSKRNSPKE